MWDIENGKCIKELEVNRMTLVLVSEWLNFAPALSKIYYHLFDLNIALWKK